MMQNHRKCSYCNHFKAYYTRGYCCLMKESNGYCNKHNKITQKTDDCDEWVGRRTSKEKRTRIVVNSLPEIYCKIAVIEQILKDKYKLKTDDTSNPLK